MTTKLLVLTVVTVGTISALVIRYGPNARAPVHGSLGAPCKPDGSCNSDRLTCRTERLRFFGDGPEVARSDTCELTSP